MKYLFSRGVAPPLGPPLFLRRYAVASLWWNVLCISVGLSKFGSQSLHFPHFYEAGPPRNASSDFQIFRSGVLTVGNKCFVALGATAKELFHVVMENEGRIEMGTSPAFIQIQTKTHQHIGTYLQNPKQVLITPTTVLCSTLTKVYIESPSLSGAQRLFWVPSLRCCFRVCGDWYSWYWTTVHLFNWIADVSIIIQSEDGCYTVIVQFCQIS